MACVRMVSGAAGSRRGDGIPMRGHERKDLLEKENEKKRKQKTNRKNKMKRTAIKRDERHGRSRYRPTKVFNFAKLIL